MSCDADAVRRLIAEYAGIDLKRVTDETHLTDDLGLDWLDQLELMVLIEDEFVGVNFFATTTAAQIELVGDIIRHIEDRALPRQLADRRLNTRKAAQMARPISNA